MYGASGGFVNGNRTMTAKTRPNSPYTPRAGRERPDVEPAPADCLERPQGLKKWATDLTRILKEQEGHLFDGWGFGPGSLTRDDFTRILKKMTGCGSVVELRAALDRNTGEMGAPAVHAANFCGQHTICPYCAGRVQDRRGARFRDSIGAMAKKYPYAYMVTATIPPRPTWREDLGELINGWQAFRRMGQKRGGRRGGRSAGEWGKVRAGLAKIELKRGAGSGLPHCHYHSLVFTTEPLDYRVWDAAEKHLPKEMRTPRYTVPSPITGEPVPASKISSEWFRASGGTNFQVDPIKYLEKHKRAGKSFEESVIEQSREVLKYATKFDSAPAADSLALFARDFVGIRDATYSRRLFITYGDFRAVGGNDFDGGGPHISEGPQIFESRWRGVRYSELIPRTRPLFPNTDASPAVSARLTVLNRAQGQVRRTRSAVLAAKNHYRETGELRPAWYMRRVWLEDGGFTEEPQALEVPGYVVAAPADMANWERWVDETMDTGRMYYGAVRENLAIASLEIMDGTMEDEFFVRGLAHRLYLRSEEYARTVDRDFIRTLLRSRCRLDGNPASSPAS